MTRHDGFPDDFIWGCATASYQIEGATQEDGRGVSIWDTFAHTPGKVAGGDTGDIACDSYHRYLEDIALLRELNANAYRFSTAWPRIQPEGSGAPNQKGLDYYDRVVDALLESGIEPWMQLYHWDLPQALEDRGGWVNRETAYRFLDFAQIMFRHFGDRIRHFSSLNEPWCVAFLGYLQGVQAPGKTDRRLAHRAVHHLLLAHGLAQRAYRESGLPGAFGIVLNPARQRPATARPEDIEAADRAAIESTRIWLDPLYGRGYPELFMQLFGADIPMEEGDLDIIASPPDFLGINYYFEQAIKAVPVDGQHPYGCALAETWHPKTAMGWDIVPEGMLRLLRYIAGTWPVSELYVTENGVAFDDVPDSQGIVHDANRIAYLRSHLHACRDAIAEGIPLKGYFLWSLMDNFEWAYGYQKRFGIVRIDPVTLHRIPKKSFYYYRDVIAGFGL
ncbi:MAG: GH1 family beta-glucosidase [Spirochaetaceae bacterium]|nr:GH1 family beta-glucosidase [Spirochaetaceae bacterium]